MNTVLKNLFTFLILAFIGASNIKAQMPYLKHFTTKDGLPSSTIYGGTQDKDGFIWFGTDVGVSRFDGKNFVNYTLADGLSDNEILLVEQDSKGRIWFLGFNGTVSYYFNSKIYNSETDTILNQIKSISSFVDIYEDKNKSIWFTTSNKFFILDTNNRVNEIGLESIKHLGGSIIEGIVFDSPSGQLIISANNIKPLIVKYKNEKFSEFQAKYAKYLNSFAYHHRDGSVLFLSKEGLVHQIDTMQKLIIPIKAKNMLDSKLVGIVLTKDNKLWLSINGKGVYIYNYSNLSEKPEFINIKKPGYLVLDHIDNVWIGTMNEGIFMLPEWANHTKLIASGNIITDNNIFSVSKSPNKELLIGLSNGKTHFLKENKTILTINPANNHKYNRVLHILCDKEDVWLASDEGVFHYNKKTKCSHILNEELNPLLPIGNVKDISILSNKLYITTPSVLLQFDLPCQGKKGSQFCRVLKTGHMRYYSVHAAKNGELWYSNLKGLFSLKNDSITDYSKNNKLFSKRINDILELSDSTIVLASYGYGLILYKNGKIIQHIKNTDGLASDICRKIFIHNDVIYVATPEGVSIIKYNKGKTQIIKNLNTTNALSSNDVKDIFADEVEVLIATSNGLVILQQKHLHKKDIGVPLLRMLSISMENQKLNKNSHYKFNYNQNSFQFEYIGIYYRSPDEVVYRYRLNNNESWQLTQNTSIDLLSLGDGKYSFQIQAKVKDGSWSPIEKFEFIIRPPFWKNNWFIAGIVLIITILTIITIQSRFRNLKKKHSDKLKLEKQINGLEQQALQAMMNPHFIFNVMNSIQQFMNSNDKHSANHYLSEFARLIRMNLNLTIKGLISLEEEINYLELYLSLEKIRFGERFSYEIIIAQDIDDDETMIPPMMIQPFLENAIWHGILPLKGKGHLILSIEKTVNKLLKIQVIDNGVGILENKEVLEVKAEAHKSYGMSLTHQRLSLIEKETGTILHIKIEKAYPENSNPGTKVELLLPDLSA
ncbi:MAG: histidine kinase [Bacteroidota bacterium]|nr:histidine kinase [Bacteroidota bacterium]